MCRGMRVEHSLTTCVRDTRDISARKLDRIDYVHRVACDENLDARLEKRIQPGPIIGDDCDAARCRFKETTRWAITHTRHRASCNVECQRRGAKERGVRR